MDSLTLYQNGLKCLDGKTVQRWGAVEQYQAVLDDLFQNVPYRRDSAVNGALSTLDILNLVKLNKTTHDKGLKQLQCHSLGKATLMQLKLGVYNDYRTARVVYALTQQVLTEATLLALECLCKRLQRTTTTTGYRTTTTTIIKQRVYRLLQHALLVIDNDCGSIQIKQALEAIVAVDHATIQVIEVGRGKATTIKLNHRTQIWRNNRDNIQDHVRRIITTLQEGIDNFQTLDGLLALGLLTIYVCDDLAQLFGLFLQVNGAQKITYCLGAHASLKVDGIVALHLTEQGLIRDEITLAELHKALIRLTTKILFFLVLFLDVCYLGAHLICGQRLYIIKAVARVFSLLTNARNLLIALCIQLFNIGCKLLAQIVLIGLTGLGIYLGNDIACKVENFLKVFALNIKQTSQREAVRRLEVPDMAHRSGKLDMTHAVTTNLGTGYLYATALAYDALKTNSLVLTARALPVLDWSKDLLAEQAIFFWLERTVVNRLRLLYLTKRPATDLIGRSKRDLNGIEVGAIEICHVCYSLSFWTSPTRTSTSAALDRSPIKEAASSTAENTSSTLWSDTVLAAVFLETFL